MATLSALEQAKKLYGANTYARDQQDLDVLEQFKANKTPVYEPTLEENRKKYEETYATYTPQQKAWLEANKNNPGAVNLYDQFMSLGNQQSTQVGNQLQAALSTPEKNLNEIAQYAQPKRVVPEDRFYIGNPDFAGDPSFAKPSTGFAGDPGFSKKMSTATVPKTTTLPQQKQKPITNTALLSGPGVIK